MDNDKIVDLIKERMPDFRVHRDEIAFRECPFCGNPKYNFELNVVKNVWHCWVCDASGGLRKLLNFLKIDYSGPVPKVTDVDDRDDVVETVVLPDGVEPIMQSAQRDVILKYLASRGMTEEDIITYNIMWWQDKSRLIFLFKNSAGNLTFWTARTIYKNVRPKYIHAEVVKEHHMVMLHGGNFDDNRVFIVEGVFDAIRIHKMGHSVIVLMGSAILDSMVEYLRRGGKAVTLVLDQDVATKQYRYEEELRKELGHDNVQAIYLPEKDVAEIGLAGGTGFSGFVRSKMHM